MLVSFRQVCGIVLGGLMTISALLSIMGIWVVGGSTIGLSYVADSFFGKK